MIVGGVYPETCAEGENRYDTLFNSARQGKQIVLLIVGIAGTLKATLDIASQHFAIAVDLTQLSFGVVAVMPANDDASEALTFSGSQRKIVLQHPFPFPCGSCASMLRDMP